MSLITAREFAPGFLVDEKLPWTWCLANLAPVGESELKKKFIYVPTFERECWCGNWGPQGECFLVHTREYPVGFYSVFCSGDDDFFMVKRRVILKEASELVELLRVFAPTMNAKLNGTVSGPSKQELLEFGFVVE